MHVAPATRPRIPLDRDWYALSDAYGIRHGGWLIAALAGLIAALPLVAAAGAYWAYAIVVPLLGAYAYKLTIVMHECCHRTLFATRALNRFVGVLCGGILGNSFDVYCRVHWGHHRHCGTEDDGGENDYLVLDGAPPGRLVAHLLKPLTGITFVEILQLTRKPRGASLGQAAAARGAVPASRSERADTDSADLDPLSPGEDEPARTPGAHRAAIVQLVVIVAVQACIALVATGGGRYPWLVLAYPLSAATFGLFFSRTRAFCEHVAYGRAEGECFVRSHEPNPFDRLFFYTLNMNLHVEHHWFPQIPSRHLPRLREVLRAGGHLRPEMTSSSILSTIAGRFREARSRLAVV
jgi:fatty acid desaturase